MANVGIVIVSHSPKIAEGAGDMVRQMVGDAVPLACTGGDPGGGLGTSAASILRAIEAAWSEAGVAILVDLGGAETNSEVAVEMLDAERRRRSVRRLAAGHRPPGGRGAFAAMTDHSPAEVAQGAAFVVNAVGLHARPSVKLTQLAKTFACRVEIAVSPDGPWLDAKSPVKVMRVSAPCGAVLHVRSAGDGAAQAAEAILSLIRDGFGEAADAPGGAVHG